MKHILFSLLAYAIPLGTAIAQTTPVWVKVANEGDAVTIPAGATLRYGAKAGTANGCGSGPALAADAWVAPKTSATVVGTANFGVSDPANCYLKELDVLQTAVAQVFTVNGKPATVPALPVVTPPATTYTITCTVTNVPSPLPTTTMPATCQAVKQ